MCKKLLSGVEEISNDVWTCQIVNDKISVNNEPYESIFSCFNKDDVKIFKREFKKMQLEYMNWYCPLVYRKYKQFGRVIYEVYNHRWCIMKDGNLIDSYSVLDDFDKPEWTVFKREVNEKLGKIYEIEDN